MPIVYYHNVVDEPVDGLDFCRLPVTDFAHQIQELAARFRIVSLPAYLETLQRAGRPDPGCVVLTFDDAYEGVFTHAFPVLAARGLPATVFVITDSLGTAGESYLPHHDEIEMALRITEAAALRFELAGEAPLPLSSFDDRVEAVRQVKRRLKVLPEAERHDWHKRILERLETPPEACRAAARQEAKLRFMSRAQLRTLCDAGWTVGSHTRSHRTVSCLGEDDLQAEIQGSLADLRNALALDAVPFAYPYGLPEHIGSRAPQVVAAAGYSCAVTATDPPHAEVDLFQLPRTDYGALAQRFI